MNLKLPSLVAILSLYALAVIASDSVTLHMIGDSTMANKPVIPANPERGWGQMFQMYFKDDLHVENYAMNGRSTKSFIAEKRWEKVAAALKPGDFVIMQFGHNDEKMNDAGRGTSPYGDYTENLRRFVHETREHKATPVLTTPTARRKFDNDGKLVNTHGVYPDAVRKLAELEKVPLLELTVATEQLLQRKGPEDSKKLFDWIPAGEFAPDSQELKDDTHFNAYGGSRICDLAVEEIEANVPALATHLKHRNASKSALPSIKK